MKTAMSTLCYIQQEVRGRESYLMLHRVTKKNDINHDKWIGVGGHFEKGESPEECILRETQEETGYTLREYRFRGLVTFCYGDEVTEYMHLFTATAFDGEGIPCDEGVLEWVPMDEIGTLELWTGDRIFLSLLCEREEFFSLKLQYALDDTLEYAALDGKEMDYEEYLETHRI